MTQDGVLASPQSISLMTYYCVAQCMFIFVCVSCRYRLIVYHITTTHVDISKMISVQQLWDIFVSSSVVTEKHTLPSSNSSIVPAPLPTLSPQLLSLDMQLKKYMQAKTPAIHIYTVCANPLEITLLSFENVSPTFSVHMILHTALLYITVLLLHFHELSHASNL